MMRLKLTTLSLLLLYLGISIDALSQDETQRYWFLGDGTLGVRFDPPEYSASTVTRSAVTYGAGGGVVVADPTTGTLLFYSDGENVYDVNHVVMPNGSGLGSFQDGNNPAVVCPVPGVEDQYYLFSNSANYNGGTIQYAIIDMTLTGNSAFPSPVTGDVDSKNLSTGVIPTDQAEGMIIIANDNGTDYWLITQTSETTTYTVTAITATGFTSTSYSGVGVAMSASTFAYNATTGQLAVAPQNANTNVLILNFDSGTGDITYGGLDITNSGVNNATNQNIYDMAWSLTGNYIYISRYGDTGIGADVLQYDVNNPTTTLASILPASVYESYGLQMAPDSSIYHLYRASAGGDILMGRIDDTDSVASLVTYTAAVFNGNDFNAMQFPSTSPTPEFTLTVVPEDVTGCTNTPVAFSATVDPGADSLVWDFGDGSTSSLWAPTYTYESAPTSQATVTAYLNGQSVTENVNVTITTSDLEITLVQDTTACECELPKDSPPPTCTQFTVTATVSGSTASMQWYGPPGEMVGQTTETLTPDSAGYYYLVVTSTNGCTAYAGVTIKEYGAEDQTANIWYFGDYAGIDFNPLPDGPAVAIANNVMEAPEGTATISDQNGQVIFFTDGETMWDRDENVLATGIGGEQGATQSSIIVPVDGDETLYYIFTTQAVSNGNTNFAYSLFDLKVGTNGAVTEQGQVLFSPSTERVTSNGTWVVMHEWGNSNFRAYQVSTDGISNPTISSAGSEHAYTPTESAEGYMKFGGDNLLAVALPNASGNTVELFDFVDSSGVVTNPRILDLTTDQAAAGEVYGIEFSPSGSKLFASVYDGSSTTLYEYAIDSLGEVSFLHAEDIAEAAGALQVGPDGQIYVAVEGAGYVLTFSANEDIEEQTDFSSLQQFSLAVSTSPPSSPTSHIGLPNFVQIISTQTSGPSMSIDGFCLGSETSFSGTGTDTIDEYLWRFGDGTTSTEQEITHTYAAAGDYDVSLEITNRCGLDTILYQTITISAPPDDPIFITGGNAVLCNGDVTLMASDGTDSELTYEWSTGETTNTIDVSDQGEYSVTITNAAGCTSDGSIIVADNRPTVDLGPDQTICEDVPIDDLDAGNPSATSYAWTINSSPSGSTQTQAVNTQSTGTYVYAVTVTGPLTDEDDVPCTASDEIVFIINEGPTYSTSVVQPSGCGTTDGEISVTVATPTTSTFTYTLSGPVSYQATDLDVGVAETATGLSSGTYGIAVTDQVSGCFSTSTETLNNAAFAVTATYIGSCDPVIDVTLASLTGTVTYRVIDADTGDEVIASTSADATSGSFTTATIEEDGNYIVEVTDAGGCINSSSEVTVTRNDEVEVTLTSDACAATATAEATNTANATFDWSGSPSGSINGSTTGTTVSLNAGTWDLVVEATDNSGAGLCTSTNTITVTVEDVITPTLSQSSACADEVTITVDPDDTGSYLYEWTRNGTVDTSLGGSTVTASTDDSGDVFSVTLYDRSNGCDYTSADLTVNVIGDISLTLIPTDAGCEGVDFTLTASTNAALSSATFEWFYGGSVISGASNATLIDNRSGTYGVTVAITGCDASAEITIALDPSTPGSLPSRAYICNDPANTDPETSQVTLDPGSDFLSYNWLKDGSSLNETSETYTATEEGIYTVELINIYNCPSTDETVVEIECTPKITGPNAFRPGGLNSTFSLFTFFIDDDNFQIYIFNRWGEMVFASSDRAFEWNGSYDNNTGKPLPPGTYSYVVKYQSSYRPEDGVQEKRGGVVLLR